MKRSIIRLGAVCATALFLGATIAETTISTVSNISYAETIAAIQTEKGRFIFSEPSIDEAASTIQWELTLTKAVSSENVTSHLLISFSDFTGMSLKSVTDASGDQLFTEQDGVYLVGEDGQAAEEQQVIVIADLLDDATQAGVTVQPQIKETTTMITENKDIMEAKITDTEQTSETYDLSSDSGNRLETEIPTNLTADAKTDTTKESIVDEEVKQSSTEESKSNELAFTQRQNSVLADAVKISTVSNWAELKRAINDGATEVRVTKDIGPPSNNWSQKGEISIVRPVKIIGWKGDETSGEAVNRDLDPTYNDGNRRVSFNARPEGELAFDTVTLGMNTFNINALVIGSAKKVMFNKVTITPPSANGARQPMVGSGAEEIVVKDSNLISIYCDYGNVNRALFDGMAKVTMSGNNTLTGYGNDFTVFDNVGSEVLFEEDSKFVVKNGAGTQGSAHHIFWFGSFDGQNKMTFEGNTSIEMDRTNTSFVGGNSLVTLTSDVASLTPKNVANTARLNLSSGNFADSLDSNDIAFKSINLDMTQSTGTFAKGSKVTFDQVTAEINIQTVNPEMKFVEAREFLVTNNSSITTPDGGGQTFRLYYTEVSNSKMTVDGQSNIDIDGEDTVVSDVETPVLAIIDFSHGNNYDKTSSELTIDSSTISLKGRSYNSGDDGNNQEGLIAIKQQRSSINVINSSKVDLKNDYGTAVFMRGNEGQFNIKDQSEFNVVSGSGIDPRIIPDEGGSRFNAEECFPGIRLFGYSGGTGDAKGNYKFNIDNASFVLTKEQGNFKSAGVRVGGNSNQINVTNSGAFEVTHKGKGSNEGMDPKGEGDLVAVQFDNIQNEEWNQASFTLGRSGVADNSRVLIDAKGGAAIHAGKGQGEDHGIISVTANPGTNFIARGNTAGAGIFNAASDHGAQGILKFKLDKPANYEIQNYNVDGDLLGAYHEGSELDAINILTSLWKTGAGHAEKPTDIISRRDYKLSGSEFKAADPEEFANGINQYSYMKSQSDIQARVTDFYQSTNADSSIFAKIELPKRDEENHFETSKDEHGRTDFVYEAASSTNIGALIVHYTDQEDQKVTTLVNSFNQGGSGVGWAPQDANIRIDLGAGNHLKPGTTIEILGSWYKGMKGIADTSEPGASEYGDYAADDLLGTQQTVDVLPPEIKVTTEEVKAEADSTIAGTTEPGAKVAIYSSDYTELGTTEAAENGAWTAKLDLTNLEKVFVYAQDTSDLTDVTLIDDGPVGNLFGDPQSINKDQGNWTLDYGETIPYHDISLVPTAFEIQLASVLKLMQVPNLDYGSRTVNELAAENFTAPIDQVENKIVVYDSTANANWEVQVSTKPIWDESSPAIAKSLDLLALYGEADHTYLNEGTVVLDKATAAQSNNNYSSDWSDDQGILFELNPALGLGTYKGKVEFVLNDGL
ncbi:hypothetical protein JZO70_09655 [Enterococcus sp. 669A]|uniref:Bacterial Ig domain-containing protein n=1 Tax=Candidatus Enterococcus moelleringii TaxID=2815325 RepID=A0ABS3L9Y2_9ENTE|nr:Ig-like domain-containing protein [Enterococcus sp. 669A]MBO1306426.1 hypothetical protein [Enterococcus sp. 669A]